MRIGADSNFRQVIVLANRGPFRHERAPDGTIRVQRSAGGLVTALEPLVQDYHLALAPRELRRRTPHGIIVSFWHIPWPAFQVFRMCPPSRELIYGLLGSDIAGFQTPHDCTRFLDCAERILGAEVDYADSVAIYRGHTTLVRAYPVGVDWENATVRSAPPASECRESVRRDLGLSSDVRLGVGIDRLDYTKGIAHKFLAIERLLESCPDLIGRFTFVQVAEPSRECLPEYRSARQELLTIANRVNARFAAVNVPIVIRDAHHEPADVYRFYRAADLCYVGSLRDGMNLVAKEFVCARNDERGVLVVSKFAGAARQLQEALVVDPRAIDTAADALRRALSMPDAEQQHRMQSLRSAVAASDAKWWATQLLTDSWSLHQARFASTEERAMARASA